MNNTHSDLEKFLRPNSRRSYLDDRVFDMLSNIKSTDTKTTTIKHFIRFIEKYQADIVAGRAHETILVGGKYEAEQKVDRIDWLKIMEALDAYEAATDNLAIDDDEAAMDIDDSDDYTEYDDDEGGE